jgi:hypothetical protein
MLKKRILPFLIFALLLTSLVACTKKDETTTTTTTIPAPTANNEEKTIEATLVGTWEEIYVRDTDYEGITVTEKIHYTFTEDGNCEITIVKSEVNVTKDEYFNAATAWIAANWDENTLRHTLESKGVSTVEEYVEKEYAENTAENVAITKGYWSVEDGLLLTWPHGGLKQFADKVEYKVENDVLYIGEDSFPRVK